MQKFEELVQAVKNLEADFAKFYEKEQAAAGTRLRKGLGDLRKLAQEIRQDVQNVKATRKGDTK